MKPVQDSSCLNVIEQHFMVSRHSYLPNDSEICLIELSARGKTIYLLDDWYNAMASSRKKNKFIVVQMECRAFFCTETLEKSITVQKAQIKKISSGIYSVTLL